MVRPSVQRLLDAVTEAPALIHDRYLRVIATNHLARAVHAPLSAERRLNLARFVFLDPVLGVPSGLAAGHA